MDPDNTVDVLADETRTSHAAPLIHVEQEGAHIVERGCQVEVKVTSDDLVLAPGREIVLSDVSERLAARGLSETDIGELVSWMDDLSSKLEGSLGVVRIVPSPHGPLAVVLTLTLAGGPFDRGPRLPIAHGLNPDLGEFDVYAVDMIGYGGRVVVARAAIVSIGNSDFVIVKGATTDLVLESALNEMVISMATDLVISEVGR